MSPTSKADGDKVYSDALDYALDINNDIKNVALSGAFGSGKSSITKSYLEKNKKKCLNISLANFEDEKITENSGSEIEKSILQQILYKEKSSKIPYSRFRKIKNIHKAVPWIVGMLLAMFISMLVVTLVAPIRDHIDIAFSNFSEGWNSLFVLTYIFSILLLGFLIKMLIVLINRGYRLRSFKLEKIKLEIEEAGDESTFNKHLDEILYYFEVGEYDAVIIEDLDRFNPSISIFSKLRELNLLINNSEQVKKKVVFIYAIKDDLFSSKIRTKFFDFIIPVVSIVDFENSGDIFTEFLKKQVKNDLVDREIVQELLLDSYIYNVCLFIDDMRLLLNAYNEFLIYYKSLKKNNENKKNDKLSTRNIFSMILYKNFYPEDFSNLIQRKGILYRIIASKNKLLIILATEKPATDGTYENYRIVEILSVLSKKAFDRFLSEILFELKQNSIASKEENASEKYEFLKFLLRKGYVDEQYYLYISYCHGSYEAQKFIMSVKMNETLPSTYKIGSADSCRKVTEKLEVSDFKQKSLVNFDMVDYMLSHVKDSDYVELLFIEKCKTLFADTLADESVYSKEFILEYFKKRGEHIGHFIKLLTKHWSNFASYFLELVNSKKITTDEMILFYSDIFNFSNEKDILNQANLVAIKDHIESVKDFSNSINFSCDERRRTMLDVVSKLGVKFSDVDLEKNEFLADEILNNGLYKVNSIMLPKVIKYLGLNFKLDKPYSSILETKNATLIEHVEKNIKELIDNFALKNEDESLIITLLNNTNLGIESKNKIMVGWKGRVSDASVINDAKVLIALFERSVVKETWENVLYYFEKLKVLDDVLFKFIEENEPTFSAINAVTPVERNKPFLAKLLATTVSDIVFECIIKNFSMQYETAGNYSSEKIRILLKHKKLVASSQWDQAFVTTHTVLLAQYVDKYWSDIASRVRYASPLNQSDKLIASQGPNTLILSDKLFIEIFQDESSVNRHSVFEFLYKSIYVISEELSNAIADYFIAAKVESSFEILQVFLAKSFDKTKKKKILEYQTANLTDAELKALIKIVDEKLTIKRLKEKYQEDNRPKGKVHKLSTNVVRNFSKPSVDGIEFFKKALKNVKRPEAPKQLPKILIVDDDVNMCQLLNLYLVKEGFKTDICHNGKECLEILRESHFDLVLLDIMMPVMDGYEALTKIRKFSNMPVIIVSAKGEPDDKIYGLELGADDYLSKPFMPLELIAKMRAVLRRSKAETKKIEPLSDIISIDTLQINWSELSIKVGGKKIDAPPKEVELLYFLASNPNRVYSRDQLLKQVWGPTYKGDIRTVDVHIKRIREKIGLSDAWSLETVWGVGFKLEIFKDAKTKT